MTTPSTPAISVIIPAYNQGDYLRQAVNSVLQQTFADLEVIIVDDGSSDHTPQVGQSFADQRVIYHRQENRGLSGARNAGLRMARGDLISFLDSDDLFLPDKLVLLRDVLLQAPAIGLAAGQAVLIDEHGDPLQKSFETHMPADAAELTLGNPFHVGSVLLRRAWREQVGFFDETLRSYEDWDYWLRLAKLGCAFQVIDLPVSRYRFHSAQMTRNGQQMTAASFAVLGKVFEDPSLPQAWHAHHDEAYANAHIRAAAHAYLAEDNPAGMRHLAQAVTLRPQLLAQDGQVLSRRLRGLTQLPKSSDPLDFLERIYHHLPPECDVLSQRAAHELGQSALNLAFEAYQAGAYRLAQRRIARAVRYHPAYLLNRGVPSVWLRAALKRLSGASQTHPHPQE